MKRKELKDAFLDYFDKPVTTWRGRPVMIDSKAGGLTLIKLWVKDEEITEQKHTIDQEKNSA